MVIPKAEHKLPGPRASATARTAAPRLSWATSTPASMAAALSNTAAADAVGPAGDIGAHVDTVAAVGVHAPGRPEHHRVTAVETAIRVSRGVRPRAVGDPAVGLDLDDGGAHTATDQGGAEQPMRSRHRVD